MQALEVIMLRVDSHYVQPLCSLHSSQTPSVLLPHLLSLPSHLT